MKQFLVEILDAGADRAVLELNFEAILDDARLGKFSTIRYPQMRRDLEQLSNR